MNYKPVSLLLLFLPLHCTLLQLTTLFRHGARYHLNSLYDGNTTKQNWGQLSPVGMRQHYNLGQILRHQYIQQLKFLKPIYNHSELEVYCDGANRTVMSAQGQLQGMFGVGTGERVDVKEKELLVPPYRYGEDVGGEFALSGGREMVPVRVVGPMYPCSNLSKEQANNLNKYHVELQQMNSRYSPLLNNLTQTFNLPTELTIQTISNLADTLTVDLYLNRPIPIPQPSYQNLLHLNHYQHLLKFSNNVSKAVSTPKLSKLLSDFDNKIANPTALHKATFLSGHDGDLYPMLLAMNFSSHNCIEEMYRFNRTKELNCQQGPAFAASIVWELHGEEGTEEYVMVKVNGKYMFLCERTEIRCGYKEWRSRVVDNVLIDTKQLCPN